MMNLRSIANSMTRLVNPNVTVTVLRSDGYEIDPATRKQVPKYLTPVTGPAQIQALDSDDLKQLEGLNIQGKLRTIFLRGELSTALRPDSKGGDLVQIAGDTWLVTKVLESWPTWTKAAIVRQGGA